MKRTIKILFFCFILFGAALTCNAGPLDPNMPVPVMMGAETYSGCGGLTTITFSGSDPEVARYIVGKRVAGSGGSFSQSAATVYSGADVTNVPGWHYEGGKTGVFVAMASSPSPSGYYYDENDQNNLYEYAVYADKQLWDYYGAYSNWSASSNAVHPSDRCPAPTFETTGICGQPVTARWDAIPYSQWPDMGNNPPKPNGEYSLNAGPGKGSYYAYTNRENNYLTLNLPSTPQSSYGFRYVHLTRSGSYALYSYFSEISCGYADPTNVSCGTANGGTFYTKPTSNLCSQGTAYSVSESEDSYTWSCNYNNQVSSCSAVKNTEPADGQCSAILNTCEVGDVSDTEDVETFQNWQCLGYNGGNLEECSVCASGYKPCGEQCIPVESCCTDDDCDGEICNEENMCTAPAQCGLADGSSVSSEPSSGLCVSPGTSGDVTQATDYSWVWQCSLGSSIDSCNASCPAGQHICSGQCVSNSVTCGGEVCEGTTPYRCVGSDVCAVNGAQCVPPEIGGGEDGDNIIQSFYADPQIIEKGETCLIHWNMKVSNPLTTCTITSSFGSDNLNSPSTDLQEYETDPLNTTTDFSLMCNDETNIPDYETAKCIVNPTVNEF